jgi:hypothetical protein
MEEIANQFQIEPGIMASKLDLKKHDVILITIDTDMWDVETAQAIFKNVSELFPDNMILLTLKGIEIDRLKTKEVGASW